MKQKNKFIFSENDKELVKKINDSIVFLRENLVTPEKKEDIVSNIQNLQNELNLRLVTRSSNTAKKLSIITIILTVLTVAVSGYTVWNNMKMQKEEAMSQKQHIELVEKILEKLQ
jgi:cytochrome b subunit of formate dehydrogenase